MSPRELADAAPDAAPETPLDTRSGTREEEDDDDPPWICAECGELVVLAGHCPRCTRAPDDTGEHVVVREDDGEVD